MASLLELGIISWINRNSSQADELHFQNLDTVALEQFISITGTTKAQLEELGQAAYNTGCQLKRSERIIKVSSRSTASIFRTMRPGWNAIDGTIGQGALDNTRRYHVGTKWRNNSCAVDVVLKAAIDLDVGRRQIDQISLDQQAKSNLAATMLRRIVSKPWGLLTAEQRTRLRDHLHQKLYNMDAQRFPLGSYLDVLDVLQATFHRLPQVSYTASLTHVCCDGVPTVPRNTTAMRGTGFYLVSDLRESVQRSLMRTLGPTNPFSVQQRCTRKANCSMVIHEQRIILDRMPPVLLLYTPAIDRTSSVTVQLFQPFQLTYQRSNGPEEVSYHPQGCIMQVNNNHYVSRWSMERNGAHQIVHYDSLKSDRVGKVAGWWDRMSFTAVVLTVFYTQA